MRVYMRGGVPYVDIRVGGRRVRERADGCSTRKEATEYAARRFLELQKAAGLEVASATLGAAAEAYGRLREPVPPRFDEELKRIASFVAHAGARTRLRSISRSHVTAWMNALEARLAPATCRRHKTSLSAFMRWARARDWIDTNPVDGAHSPQGASRKKAALEPARIRAILDVAAEIPALHAVYMLAFYAGLRRSEIVRARYEDVDLERGTLFVRGRKTRGAEALLPLHPDLGVWLRSRWQAEGFIVANAAGGPYHPASINNLRVELAARRRTPLPPFHLARHSLATIILQEGGTLDDVAALLRISPRTAAEFYAWLSPHARGAALSRFRLPG